MNQSWQNGAPAKQIRDIRVKKDNTILLREIANQKREIGRLGLFCYNSGRSPDKSGDLAALTYADVLIQTFALGCYVYMSNLQTHH